MLFRKLLSTKLLSKKLKIYRKGYFKKTAIRRNDLLQVPENPDNRNRWLL